VKQEKTHRTIERLRVQSGGVLDLSKKQRGAKVGTKMPKRINLELWTQLQAAQEGEVYDLTGAEPVVVVNDDNVEPDEPDEKLMKYELEAMERHKELVRIRAKLLFEADEHNDEDLLAQLVNVSWNEGWKCITGYYYDTAVRNTLPLRGGLLDLEHPDIQVCTMKDVDECYEAHQRMLKKGRDSGERSGDDLAEWEKRLVQQENRTKELLDKVLQGHVTMQKYKAGLKKMKEDGYLYEADYESDVEWQGDEADADEIDEDASYCPEESRV
jgi:hypothetical protein